VRKYCVFTKDVYDKGILVWKKNSAYEIVYRDDSSDVYMLKTAHDTPYGISKHLENDTYFIN
jgi:hypothetical protein